MQSLCARMPVDTREPDLGLGGKSDGPAVTRTQHGARVGSIRNLPERGDGKVVGVTEGR